MITVKRRKLRGLKFDMLCNSQLTLFKSCAVWKYMFPLKDFLSFLNKGFVLIHHGMGKSSLFLHIMIHRKGLN